jgi:hypothetical protein
VKRTRTEAAVTVDAATGAFYCAGSGGPGCPARLKAGRAPAERGQAGSEALRWAGVVSCTAVALASLVLVGTPSAAAMGAPGATSAWQVVPGKGPMSADLEPASQARAPAGLQAAIDKALAARPVTSPTGIGLSWGRDGTVWFSRSKGPAGLFELSPLSMGRSHPRELSPGPFVFGPRRTTEALGDGLTAWYATTPSGFEQGFTVSQPPAGRAGSFSINMFYSSSLDPAVVAPGRLSFSGPAGPVLAYGPLQATDASGLVVPTQLSLADGNLQIVVYDARATFPLDIDCRITASRAPVASFSGTSGASFGESVSLAADGREALVGAQFANAAYLFEETAGIWPTTPVASFTGSSGQGLGFSVALSADGRVALVGTPFANSQNGAVYVYEESAGGWPTSPVAALSGNSGEALGESVALSADGRVALVGAPAAGTGGAAYLYRQSAGSWDATPTASFLASSRDEGLGSSVALSADGRVALVSTQFARSGAGAAYLYAERAGAWPTMPTASFIGSSGEGLGFSVALSADGRVALVGAPFASGVNGAAYLYTESAGSWPTVPAATFTGSLDQSLGSSVALSAHGRVALVGGPGALLGGGTANVYTESGGRWHTNPVVAFRGGSGAGLGSSVALSADGREALVGADTARSGGAAFVYTSSG